MSLKDEIKKAVGDHGAWKKAIRNKIDPDTVIIDAEVAKLEADNQCCFGKWIYGPLVTAKEKNSDHYQKVRELHNAFHEKASKVAQLATSGDKAGAMRMLEMHGEFTKASAALSTAMLEWLKETK